MMDEVNKASGGVQAGNGSGVNVQQEQDAVSSRQQELLKLENFTQLRQKILR